MNSCWEEDPKDRPSFSELVKKLVAQLGSMAEYLTFDTTEEDGYKPTMQLDQ